MKSIGQIKKQELGLKVTGKVGNQWESGKGGRCEVVNPVERCEGHGDDVKGRGQV